MPIINIYLRKKLAFLFISLITISPTCTILSLNALACGDETGSSCDNDKDDARYMLKDAVAAVQKDEAKALAWFTEMSHGFRTQELYVFCIGPNHVMDAHPDPNIIYTDILTTLIDRNDFHFREKIWNNAKEGEISDIIYLYPSLEISKHSVKHTIYTKVKDQVCAVGYYDWKDDALPTIRVDREVATTPRF